MKQQKSLKDGVSTCARKPALTNPNNEVGVTETGKLTNITSTGKIHGSHRAAKASVQTVVSSSQDKLTDLRQ